ncbi:MAG: murein tripeptide amidase MpaA [Paraglaciecola sp.]|jgi:murein tripeptide amidase MpaA
MGQRSENMVRISSNFDSGNIQVIRAEKEDDIQLAIRKDNQSDFFQWFHFKLDSTAMVAHKITLNGLSQSAYPGGWENYHAVASYDRQVWFRVDSRFDGEKLEIEFSPECSQVYMAYFAPYSYERHLDLLSWAQTATDCKQVLLGETLDGRDMSMLVIGSHAQDETQEGKKSIWITARQHPGETMAEWLVEGLLERLLDEDDGLARLLLDKAVFYVVPNMNPDGSVRGHLRTNALGVNLNREWANPSMERSPEVFLVKQAMQQTGVDLFLDMHGDEALPYNFVAGCEGNPNYSARLQELEEGFKQALLTATPEFQDVQGYDKDKPGEAILTVAANAIGHEFDCLSYTLEMPFKDNIELADPAFGWSPSRSKQLGEDILIAIRAVVDTLR